MRIIQCDKCKRISSSYDDAIMNHHDEETDVWTMGVCVECLATCENLRIVIEI